MTVLSSAECGVPPPPPPPISVPAASSPPPAVKPASSNGTAPDTNLLFLDIRNGITLKPTKTKDKSTPAFIKTSNCVNTSPSPPPQTNGVNEQDTTALEGMKDALQEELRNTLKRKVKKHSIEQGDCEKNRQIEEAMAINRTEVQLKVNTSADTSPNVVRRDVVDKAAVRSPIPQRAPVKYNKMNNGNVEDAIKSAEFTKSPVLQKPPAKPERAFITNTLNNAQTLQASTAPPNGFPKKEISKEFAPIKATVKPIDSSKVAQPGSLKKIGPQKALQIEINPFNQDDCMKNSILSPEVKSGSASIRPSQIKTLTKQGSHVSHTDIVEHPKLLTKSPISLVETPKPYYSPPTPKFSSPSSSGQSSPRTPTRTTILDTKLSYSLRTPLTPTKMDPNAPMKKLLISHPKASFTLPRTNKRQARPSIVSPNGAQESKPVFKILTNLEQAERREEAEAKSVGGKQQHVTREKSTANGDSAGAEPILTSYVSFAKDLANAPNNHPDTVKKTTTVGTVKQDLFFDNMNLRDVKFDIVENGQLRVVNK
ncbi:immunoglobulin A1 protease autotransporter-like [Topomyia yanbarensis]|uniref:immunoglobulin A1 protease autotransporter-like n=1 Tax=Topomyia yanbarensis TaxID=2498891 RepID=UPI00273C57AC|nr:immunoglobulin A1 protease autotransporter-like [Topomyia yanbarensis]